MRSFIPFAVAAFTLLGAAPAAAGAQPAPPDPALGAAAPAPIRTVTADDWIAVFKFNARTAPTAVPDAQRPCPFGGKPAHNGAFSQAYAFASRGSPQLRAGPG